MFAALELCKAIKSRRAEIGITQAELSRLSGLSRATVNQIENGTLHDLSFTRTERLLSVLGFTLSIIPAGPKSGAGEPSKTPPLTLAARAASVSYRDPMTPEALERILLTGEVPSILTPHLNTLLEDASVAMLAAVAQQLHDKAGAERALIWSTMRALAQRLGSRRDIWG